MSGNERRQDGSLIPGDALFVQQISGINQPLNEMCPFVYEHAYSPHLASRLEGNPVNMEDVKKGFHAVSQSYDYVTLEGSGGILCPLCFDEENIQLEDVIRELHLSSLIVADAGLGTINATVLTIEYMRARGFKIEGIILNRFVEADEMHQDNLAMIEKLGSVDVVATVAEGGTLKVRKPFFVLEV